LKVIYDLHCNDFIYTRTCSCIWLPWKVILSNVTIILFPHCIHGILKVFQVTCPKINCEPKVIAMQFFRFVNSRYPYLVWFVMLKGKDMTVPPISAIFPALGFRRFRHRLILSFTALFLSVSEPPLNFLIYQVMIFSVSNFSQFLYGTLLWTKLWQMLVRRILLIAKMVERSCPSDWSNSAKHSFNVVSGKFVGQNEFEVTFQ
jgi:hypothetical protein